MRREQSIFDKIRIPNRIAIGLSDLRYIRFFRLN
jgi:hypothetical protein